MTDSLTLIVLLHFDPAHTADFERYETAASRIMMRHGGGIERRVGVAGVADAKRDPDRPGEVHVVTFPSEEAFNAYLQDPELAALGALRARAIRRTVVWGGNDLPAFTEE